MLLEACRLAGFLKAELDQNLMFKLISSYNICPRALSFNILHPILIPRFYSLFILL